MIIKYSKSFLKDAKRLKKKYRNIATDIKEVENHLIKNGIQGDLIPDIKGYNIYKLRQKNSSVRIGKSGGFRVIYYQVIDDELIMLSIYSKTEKENILKSEIIEILNNN
jgi:mRNA-degrading endonuclease RelE of RelBE toxin-antitoxin system